MMSFQLAAKQHALEESPKEACGIVVNDIYYRCINISDTPEDNFAIHPKDFLKARSKGKLQYIVHSHPKGGNASKPDKKPVQLQRYLGTSTLFHRIHGKL